MDKMLKAKHLSKESDFIALFLPGFPGEYKERPIFDDLKSYNADIYCLVYSGTYGVPGKFTISGAASEVRAAIKSLARFNKPILIIAYSFSTLFVADCIDEDDNLMGVLFFSPITDLKNCIREDFLKTLKEIQSGNEKDFNIDLKSFDEFIYKFSETNYLKSLKKLESMTMPLLFFLGVADRNVKTDFVYELLSRLQIPKKLVYLVKGGEHRLDSLYQVNYVRKVVLNLVLSNKIRPEERFCIQ